MLKRIFSQTEQKNFQLPIGEASEQRLFSHSPEFNPPAHGVWNIVHVGMLLPEAYQIYVCGINCMRGVVLTAAEMGEQDRFSMVLLEERDLIEGRVEDVTLEGVVAALEELPKLPPVVMVFTVCTHRFLGCDLNYIYKQLEARFPQVRFLKCFMEPITQKRGLSPDQRLRETIFSLLPQCPPKKKTAAILGSDFVLNQDADLRRMLRNSGWELLELPNYKTYESFLTMGQAEAFFSVFPRARYGAERNAQRLKRAHCYLPSSFSYEEIETQENQLAAEFGLQPLDTAAEKSFCEAVLSRSRGVIGDREIAIDHTLHPRPLGLARLLLSHGFSVKKVYMDAVAPEEVADFKWLNARFPELLLCATMQPQLRVLPRESGNKILALGQIAAWAENTPHFVNLVEGGGLWGFAGIRSLAGMMEEAVLSEKDTADLVPRKGLGCESLI